MRLLAVSLCLLAAAPAVAKEGNPLGGIGVAVEQSGQTTMVQYNNANDARAACTAAGGAFSASAGKLKCANPRSPLQPTRTLRVGDPRDPAN